MIEKGNYFLDFSDSSMTTNPMRRRSFRLMSCHRSSVLGTEALVNGGSLGCRVDKLIANWMRREPKGTGQATVDRRNPAAVDTSQVVVWDFFHQQYCISDEYKQ